MAPKPLPDNPVILEDLFNEARRYIDDFEPIADKLLSLKQKKPDGDASLVRSPWDLDYQKAIIDDIYKRLAASSSRPIALFDYIESDIFADIADIRLRMGGVDPNSNPSMTALLLFQQTLDKVRVLYRNIIAKLENQKATSPTTPLISDTPRRHSPAVSPEGDTRSSFQRSIETPPSKDGDGKSTIIWLQSKTLSPDPGRNKSRIIQQIKELIANGEWDKTPADVLRMVQPMPKATFYRTMKNSEVEMYWACYIRRMSNLPRG